MEAPLLSRKAAIECECSIPCRWSRDLKHYAHDNRFPGQLRPQQLTQDLTPGQGGASQAAELRGPPASQMPTSLSEPLLLTGYQGSSMPTVPQSELLFTQQELLVCTQSRAAPWLLRALFCCKEIGGYFGATWQKEHVKLGNCQVIWTNKKSEECEHVLEYLLDLYYPN